MGLSSVIVKLKKLFVHALNLLFFKQKTSNKKRKGESPASVAFIRDFVMIPQLKASSKEDAIDKMILAIQQKYPTCLHDVAQVKADVMRREASMPTGLDHGIAVPHGRTNAVTQILGSVALVDNSENENGAISDWETIDHSRIQIIVLTLVPEDAQRPYLQIMAFITHLLHRDSDDLLLCKTAREMIRFFDKSI